MSQSGDRGGTAAVVTMIMNVTVGPCEGVMLRCAQVLLQAVDTA